MVDEAAAHMERTGVRLLWGTANLFAHPRYAAGAGVAYNSLTILNPAAPVAGTSFANDGGTPNQLTARWINRTPVASDIVRYVDASVLVNGTFTVGRDIQVDNTRANAVTLGTCTLCQEPTSRYRNYPDTGGRELVLVCESCVPDA